MSRRPVPSHGPPATEDAPLPLRLALAGAACGSVVPLLAWVYGASTFALAALVVGAPLVLLTVGAALWMERTGRWPGTRAAVTAGALGGLLGTLGYDLFRVPFVAIGGLQLLAPIESYGVLLLDAAASSPLTAWSAWSYHVVNGVGFGVAYAVVARGRHWGWGVLWGLVLETAVVVSPFADVYALRTADGYRWTPILLAYAAHVPYGYAVGRFAQRADERHARAVDVARRPVTIALLVTALGLAVWLRPGTSDGLRDAGVALDEGPSVVVSGGDWHPRWLRLAPGACVTVRNDDPEPLTVAPPASAPVDEPRIDALAPGATGELCPDGSGVRRLQVDGVAFSGGWLIIDEELRP